MAGEFTDGGHSWCNTLLIRCIRRVNHRSKMRARGQLIGARQGRECLDMPGSCGGIEKGSDPLFAECRQGRARRSDLVSRGRRRNQRADKVARGILEQPRGIAGRIVRNPAGQRLGRRAVNLCERECARIGQRRMAEGILHQDRPVRVERIERRARRGDALGAHVVAVPVDDLKPGVGFILAPCIEADLDPRLKLGNSERRVVEIALRQAGAAGYRMHVPVDQARHQHPPLQIGHARGGSDVLPYPGIGADVGDAACADRNGLPDAVPGIDRIDIAVLVYGIGRGWLGGRNERQYCERDVRQC